MCGFAGFLDPYRRERPHVDIVNEMAATLIHRGPDDEGCWVDEAAGVALGFRRLSILDLSAEGHQPMVSHDGRHVIVFNGEIYNYLEIRRELDAEAATPIPWRGHADTEVLLAAITRWGLARTLAALDGMFAFALWDRQERTLVLARDRLGEKPLYYGWCCGAFLFGSELKALRRHPAWQGGVDRDALGLYMRLGWIPAPHTIHPHVAKLTPGCVLTLAKAGCPGAETITPYWSARQQALAAAAVPFDGDFKAAADRLESLLRQSVALRLRADVPVGVFLSGGIDSATLAAMMQAVSPQPVHSFTIGFAEAEHDESPAARAVAAHLGTRHTEYIINETDALRLLPDMATVYDEPMADAAQLPTCLLSGLARGQVAVALSGDGGDELLGGYPRHEGIASQWRRLRRMPGPLRAVIGAMGVGLPAEIINGISGAFSPAGRRSYPGYRLRWSLKTRAATGPAMMLRHHLERWRGTPSPVLGAGAALSVFDEAATWSDDGDAALSVMLLDALAYLPDDLCVKTDRASMAVSLEARLPFLDHKIAEFAWSLPTSYKIAGGIGKRVLRDVLYRMVPRELVDRPKKGFTVPIDRWLRGRLRPWADDLLSEDRLRRQGYLDPDLVSRCWRDHRDGRRNWQSEVWFALMFQAWVEEMK